MKPKIQLELFPATSLKSFFLSVFFLVFVLVVADAFVIPRLEDEGKLVSTGWYEDDQFIFCADNAKNMADMTHCPVWRSKGWPVTEKCSKRRRILVIGDSFAWGDGYSNMNDIWWRQLERELKRRGYNDVEVIAAGMWRLNTRLELDVAKMVIPLYHPDLVILGYVTNDPDETVKLTAADFDQKFRFRPHRSYDASKAIMALLPNLSYQLVKLRSQNLPQGAESEFAGRLGNLKGSNWAQYGRTVKEMGLYLNSLSIPSFVITLPCDCPFTGVVNFGKIKELYDRLDKPVQREFEANNVSFVDSFDTWMEAAKGEENLLKRGVLWFGISPANSHPNTWATHAYAQKAADVLESKYRQCLGPKTDSKIPCAMRINDWMPPDMPIQVGGSKVVLVYPMEGSESFRYMPIRQPFIQLSFECPIGVQEIRLGGTGLKQASLYVTREDPKKHFDDGTFFALGGRRGNWLDWKLPKMYQSNINTLNIAAEVSGPAGEARALLLEFIP